MMDDARPLVSVTFTAFRRVDHLRRTITAFRQNCTYENLECILLDDGSSREEQAQMRQLPFDLFVFAEKNRGLGANMNRGLRLARGEYILNMQDDWVLARRNDFIPDAIAALAAVPQAGLVRVADPHEAFQASRIVKTAKGLGVRLALRDAPGAYGGIYHYSDQPHVKHRTFHERMGLYAELPGVDCEDEFAHRFLAQDELTIASIVGHEGTFRNIGLDLSYVKGRGKWRMNLRHRLQNAAATRAVMRGYDRLPERLRWIVRGTPQKAFAPARRPRP